MIKIGGVVMVKNNEKEIQDLLDKGGEGGGDFPEVWNPKTGDSLIGTVVRIAEPMTSVGQRKVIELQDGKGKMHSLWMRQVLQSEFERQDVKEGDLVGIKFLGKVKGKRYFGYRVVKK